jgi:hypothetical protein
MLRQGDAQVFKEYSQMPRQRYACRKQVRILARSPCKSTILARVWHGLAKIIVRVERKFGRALKSILLIMSGRSAAW